MDSLIKRKLILPIIAIIAGLTIIVVFIIYPTLIKITSISREIINERVELENKMSFGINLKKIQMDLEEVSDLENELKKIYINKGNELDYITKIENTAAAAGVNININSADFTGKNIGDSVKEIPLQMNFSGDYKNIIGFFQAMEAMPNYYNLNLIVINKEQQNKISVQTIGQTYLIEKK